ncbi:MAG TPA: hypothetical protein VKQ72_17655 [Aggregatilineales bacterium]|nr:hypothetical protein [Aggregatilineales bacterium]
MCNAGLVMRQWRSRFAQLPAGGQLFLKGLRERKGTEFPCSAPIKAFASPRFNLPDVTNQFAVGPFLDVFLDRLHIDPYLQRVRWYAEQFRAFGYAFVVFYLTGNDL